MSKSEASLPSAGADRAGAATKAQAAVEPVPVGAASESDRRQHAGPDGLPLGPGSLTWKLFGDARGWLIVGRTGVLQTMHPTISQALVDHSDYFQNPLNRLVRSSGPILSVVYGSDPEGTGHSVRDWHKPIKGHHPDGQSYRALDADAYFWAHVTFFESQIARMQFFGTPLTLAEKQQLWLEAITWYKRYGLSMKIVPRSYEAFLDYWDGMFADTLKATPVALSAVHHSPLPAPSEQIPPAAWAVLGPVISRSGPWITRGTLPRRAKEMLGVEWSPSDEAALHTMRVSIRASWRLMPRSVAWIGPAREAASGARKAVAA